MNRIKSFLGGGLLLAAALTAHGEDIVPPPDFVTPTLGSYRLERIIRAPDGFVLDAHSSARRLSEFTTGRITLLSFIYTSCSDVWGCPLAYQVMDTLKTRVSRERNIARHVRFVSLSFDPDRDTPEVMRSYGGSHTVGESAPQWYFLTTRSPAELKPLLEGFGQDLSIVLDEDGESMGALSHVLKVFLIDRGGSVREIYSTSYLRAGVVLNDIKTLLLEEGTVVN